MSKHFIFDMETIGQDIFSAPIVNCAYYVFDWDRFTSDNPYTFEELIETIKFDKLDVAYQIKENGCVMKKSDLDWWSEQGEFAYKQIKPSAHDIHPDEFISRLLGYAEVEKPEKWWSRSNSFDPVILQRAVTNSKQHDMVAVNKVLPFWQLRDTRTFIDTRFNFKLKYNTFCPIEDEAEWNKIFVKHCSYHDVAADILRMQKIEQVVNS